MKVERITPVPLDKNKAITYASAAAYEQTNKRIKKARYVGGGSFGRAVEVRFEDGEIIIVKLLLSDEMAEKEAHDLELLGKHCSVKIPSVLFLRKSDEHIPVDCYGMERIDGRNAFLSLGWYFKPKEERRKFAEVVTEALHSVHECKSEKFGDTLNPDCDEWLDVYRPFAKAVMDKAEELHAQKRLSKKIIEAMRAAWRRFDDIFAEKVEEAVLIHGDLNVANIMVNKKGVTGFIDPLNSMYADREYDLFQFDNMTGKRFFLRETYTEKYGASKLCRQKLAFYGLWNEVYCLIKSGVLINFIMNPLIKNMYKTLSEL